MSSSRQVQTCLMWPNRLQECFPFSSSHPNMTEYFQWPQMKWELCWFLPSASPNSNQMFDCKGWRSRQGLSSYSSFYILGCLLFSYTCRHNDYNSPGSLAFSFVLRIRKWKIFSLLCFNKGSVQNTEPIQTSFILLVENGTWECSHSFNFIFSSQLFNLNMSLVLQNLLQNRKCSNLIFIKVTKMYDSEIWRISITLCKGGADVLKLG